MLRLSNLFLISGKSGKLLSFHCHFSLCKLKLFELKEMSHGFRHYRRSSLPWRYILDSGFSKFFISIKLYSSCLLSAITKPGPQLPNRAAYPVSHSSYMGVQSSQRCPVPWTSTFSSSFGSSVNNVRLFPLPRPNFPHCYLASSTRTPGIHPLTTP
jgi:hypothetical protein